MTQRIWTEPVLRNVFALLIDGYDYGEIAAMYGVTRCAVRSRMNQTWVGPAFRARAGLVKVRAKRVWTEERKAEFRRLYWSGQPVSQIAKTMGVTTNAAKRMLTTLGIADRSESVRRLNARRRGWKHTAETIEGIRQKAKQRFQDPEYRARHAETHSSEVMRQRQREQAAKKRGFAVPDEKAEDYRRLTQGKKFTAREAGVMLGLVTSEVACG